jgi:hypothetical protein
MGMQTTMYRSIPLTIKKLIVEYVSAPKTCIDMTKYNVVYDNNVNSYVKKRSLLRHVDDDSYIDPPQTAHELMIDYMFNMLNGDYSVRTGLGPGLSSILGPTTTIGSSTTTFIPLNFTTTTPISTVAPTNIPNIFNTTSGYPIGIDDQIIRNHTDFIHDRLQYNNLLPTAPIFPGHGHTLGNNITEDDSSDDSNDDSSDDDSPMNEPD